MAGERVPDEEIPGLGLLGPRARHLLALEFGSKEQFYDPRREWRRLFSELLGTFFLVLAAAGGAIIHGEDRFRAGAALVMAAIAVANALAPTRIFQRREPTGA